MIRSEDLSIYFEGPNKLSKAQMREVVRSLRPNWSDEQFDAHWNAFIKLKASVARSRRKQSVK